MSEVNLTDLMKSWNIREATSWEQGIKVLAADETVDMVKVPVKDTVLPSNALLHLDSRAYFDLPLSRKWDVFCGLQVETPNVELNFLIGGHKISNESGEPSAIVPLVSLMYNEVCIRFSLPPDWRREDDTSGIAFKYDACLLQPSIRRSLMQAKIVRCPLLNCSQGCFLASTETKLTNLGDEAPKPTIALKVAQL